jgi:hypothetical protein
MNKMGDYITMILTHEVASDLRASAGLVGVNLDAPRQRIASDSLCDRAGRLINDDQYLPDTTTRRVFLIRVGNRYWAEDSTLPRESRIPAYVLDSTLSTVVVVFGR